jgi:hypothetical protein
VRSSPGKIGIDDDEQLRWASKMEGTGDWGAHSNVGCMSVLRHVGAGRGGITTNGQVVFNSDGVQGRDMGGGDAGERVSVPRRRADWARSESCASMRSQREPRAQRLPGCINKMI